jgi:hypothetical protein
MIRPLLALFALLAAAPAFGATILKEVPSQLAPDRAYVLVELRENEFPATEGVIILARYDPAGGDVRGGRRSPGSAPPAGEDLRITVNRKALAKTGKTKLYLVELEPDTWVIEGTSSTAFSLGSKSFVLEPGTVTDLGVIAPHPDWREGDSANKQMGKLIKSALLGPFGSKPRPQAWMAEWRERGPDDIPLPAELAARARPVRFAAEDVRFGNYLGGLVNRFGGRADRPDADSPPAEEEPAPTAE